MPIAYLRKTILLLVLFVGACSSKHSLDKGAAAKANRHSESGKGSAASQLKLHVPSPDWRDQIIYFAMIDRFSDGDTSNNDQGAGVYDPGKESHYSGGDIKGLVEGVDYIQALGATALWVTPPVANMWWDPKVSYSGYHGYWARDFSAVDEHYGSLQDFQQLSHTLHTRDMFLIQDIVVNHVGNYFSYEGAYDPNNPRENFRLNPEALPGAAPTQPPFDKVNIFDSADFNAEIYNWTPEINNFSDYLQETRYQTSSLSDLNTRNPTVIAALKHSYSHWIKEAGIDGFRIDTAKYVEEEFYREFLHGAQGVYETAAATGRDNFFTFGEIYNTSAAYQDEGERKLKKYLSSTSKKLMDAAIGFPLYKEIQRVFADGAPTDYLRYRVEKQMSFFDAPFLQTNFIDNHDVARFLAAAGKDEFKLAYAFMMTAPGIPVIYQGDEQLFVESRKAMFSGGYLNTPGSFDQNSEMFKFIRSLSYLRRQHQVFSRGQIEFIQSNDIGPGILFYKRSLGNQEAYVLINTASHKALLNVGLGKRSWSEIPQSVFSFNGNDDTKLSWNQGIVAEVNANSAQVFIGTLDDVTLQEQYKNNGDSLGFIRFDEPKGIFKNSEAVEFTGTSSLIEKKLLLVLDGKLTRAREIPVNSSGKWRFILEQKDLGRSKHAIELYAPSLGITSSRHQYEVIRQTPELSASFSDPRGDDSGPTKTYRKPLHDSVGCEMDITAVSLSAGGSVLELSLKMCEVSDMWEPSNFFDHVAFSIYFDLPREGGNTRLPLVGADYPNGGSWDLAHIAYGWGNYLYSNQGASADREGEKIGRAPQISVDKENKTISFRYFGKTAGVETWKGASIYITTWDKDGTGNYRPLSDEPSMWEFGAAELKYKGESVKILDDLVVRVE